MQVRYEITPSDHLEMLKARFGISAKLPIILLGIFGTDLGIFAYFFSGDIGIVVTVMFGGLTLVQIFFPYIIHRKIYYRNPVLFEMRTMTFDDEGVTSERATGRVQARWSRFVKFRETKNLFMTYQGKDVVGIVPKRAFPNPETLTQFRNLLVSKMPSSTR